MKRNITLLGFAALLLAIVSGSGTTARERTFAERFAGPGSDVKGASGAYSFDRAHSFIGFKVRHNGLIEVPGFFRDFTGSVNYDANDVARSSVTFSAKTTSIDTGVTNRDNHLRTADFFDVEKFPEMTFKSTSVRKKGKNWLVTGDLTLRGVTKQITFPFQIVGWLENERGTRMGISAETSINRREFGVNYGKTLPGGIAELSDDVKVVLQIEALMRKEQAPAK
jgi:polyisoprenoid-binding protein YceI